MPNSLASIFMKRVLYLTGASKTSEKARMALSPSFSTAASTRSEPVTVWPALSPASGAASQSNSTYAPESGASL